eukprot:14900825-Alexandrium_andersonii.AAC.1
MSADLDQCRGVKIRGGVVGGRRQDAWKQCIESADQAAGMLGACAHAVTCAHNATGEAGAGEMRGPQSLARTKRGARGAPVPERGWQRNDGQSVRARRA